MKPLNFPNTKETSAHMRKMARINRKKGLTEAEGWMQEKLADTGHKWNSQAQWGYRLFDFWCHELGVVIEVDGPEHDKNYDQYRDEYNFRRSGIVVLRVRNFNEEDAKLALEFVAQSDKWSERREALGIKGGRKEKRKLAAKPYSAHRLMHKKYIEKRLAA